MKKVLFMAFSALSLSCASVKTERVSSAPPKQKGCELAVFYNESDVKKKYEIVCLLNSRTGNSIWNKRTGDAAVNLSKKQACKCGADAVIVTSSGQTKLKFYSYKRGIASVKAIRYL
jgi:hypothetical protein